MPRSSTTTVGQRPSGRSLCKRRRKGLGERQPVGIERHADLGSAAEAVELGHLVGRGDAARDRDRGIAGGRADLFREAEVGALQAPLALDEGHEKAAREPAQRRDPLEHALAGALLPAFDDDLAVARVERRDDPLARQFF